MKMKKLALALCGVLCFGVAFTGCGQKDDKKTDGGQSFSQIAVRNTMEQLEKAKKIETTFELTLTEAESGPVAAQSETPVTLFDVDGALTLHAGENSISWGAELSYADETEKDRLFATNSSVGLLNEELGVYEPVDMMPTTAVSFGKLFEKVLTATVGSSLTGEGGFNALLAAYLETNGTRTNNDLSVCVPSTQTAFMQGLLTGFGGECTVATAETELSFVLEKSSGISELTFDCEFTLSDAEETESLLGRDVELSSAVNGSFSVVLTGISTTAEPQLPKLDVIIYPLYSKVFHSILDQAFETKSMEITLRGVAGGGYEYVLKLTVAHDATEYVYTFSAPTQKEEITEFAVKLENCTVSGADITDKVIEYYETDSFTFPVDLSANSIDLTGLDFEFMALIYPLYSMTFTPVCNEEMKSKSVEITLRSVANGDYEYVLKLTAVQGATEYVYTFSAPTQKEAPTELSVKLEGYTVSGVDYTQNMIEYYGKDTLTLPVNSETKLIDCSQLDFGIALFGELWTLKTKRQDKATVVSFEMVKETRGDKDYFVITLKMKWRDTKWHYVVAAEAPTEPIGELNISVEYYYRTDSEGEYDVEDDLTTEEQSGVVRFDWTNKVIDLSVLMLPSTWSGSY